jgi:hypothetical protein
MNEWNELPFRNLGLMHSASIVVLMLEVFEKGEGPRQRMLAIPCTKIIHSLQSEGHLSVHSSPAQIYGKLLSDQLSVNPLTSAIALTPSCIVELMSSSSLLCECFKSRKFAVSQGLLSIFLPKHAT